MKKEDLTKTEFKKVVAELNEQLGLEPPILEGLAKNAMSKAITEAASLIDPENDEFSDYAWEVMEAMGVAQRPEEPEEESPNDAAVAELIEEANEDNLVEDFKACKKLKELKEMAAEWDLFQSLDLAAYTGLGGLRGLKEAMLACMPEETRALLVETSSTTAKSAPSNSPRPSPDRLKERNIRIEQLIAAGEYTRKQIMEKLLEEYPEWSKSSFQTILCDSKNEKYTKFAVVTVEDENNVMSFKKGE